MADNAKEEALQKAIADLKAAVQQRRTQQADTTLRKYAEANAAGLVAPKAVKLTSKRTPKGHMSKIYSIQWSEVPTKLEFASASLDGWMLIWDAPQNVKLHFITVKTHYLMACGYCGAGQLAACGGLTNTVSIYNLRAPKPLTKPTIELQGHDGFISCIRFLSDKEAISSAGDHTSILWDIGAGKQVTRFSGHTGEVSGISISADKKLFVSGSADRTARVWDIRSGKCVVIFNQHNKDVSGVSFFPSGTAVATSSEDSACRLWDIRASAPVLTYGKPIDANAQPGTGIAAASIACSAGGRYLFAGYDDGNIKVWDTVSGENPVTAQHSPTGLKVATLGVSADGTSLCSGSWDNTLKVWTI
jgi:guanine nucleotide-binding protein G(I)/G(S)/G(T) subunit beta-1